MRFFMFVAGLAGALGLSVAPAGAEPVKTTFTLVGQTYNVTLPEGYCLPQGQSELLAQTMAGTDPQNLTDLTFFDCDVLKPGATVGRYGMIKTPKQTLLMLLPTREQLLAQFKASIADGSMAEAMHKAEVADKANKAIQDATGLDLKLKGEPKFIETDGNAAYLEGVVTANANGQERQVGVIGAMTEVKGRVIAWFIYAPQPTTADMGAMLQWMRPAIARFIADNGG